MAENHAISMYVCNKSGVLARIALIFTKRGYNIDSLVVSHGQDPHFSWMNIEASGDGEAFNLMLKQLNKLVDVIQVKGYTGRQTSDTIVERELALIKFSCPSQQRSEVLDMLKVFRGEVVDVGQKSLTCQITGSTDKVEALIKLLAPYGVLEVVRTGKIIIERGLVKEPKPENMPALERSPSDVVFDWRTKAIQE